MFKKLIRKIYKKELDLLYKRLEELEEKRQASLEALAYQTNYTNRTTRKVVYTCITGNYDDLLQHNYVSPEHDYICYTDNEKLLRFNTYGIWKIRPLEYNKLDNTKNARWHKIHPHLLLTNYDESIWVDANISIKSEYLFSMFSSSGKVTLRVPIHNLRVCIYEEAPVVIEKNKDTVEPVEKMIEFLKRESFQTNYGLNETNIIYRKHKDEVLIKMMELWWNCIEKYSKRDQLSFSYVLWKNGITPADIAIPNIRNNEKNFRIYQHNK